MKITVFGTYPPEFARECKSHEVDISGLTGDLKHVVILRDVQTKIESIEMSPGLFDEALHGKAWKCLGDNLRLSESFLKWMKQEEKNTK
jgi:hypothetical protein